MENEKTNSQSTDGKKQPKMNKAQLKAVSEMLKQIMNCSISDLVDAIEKDPKGVLALQYYCEMIVDDVLKGILYPVRQDGETEEHFQERLRGYEKAKPILEKVFFMGITSGTQIEDFYRVELPNLKQLRDEEQSKQ